MSTYRMTYGDAAGKQVQETFEGVEVEREDGWVVLFRGTEAILRLQEQHVRSLERVPDQ
jgi:phosphomannomutase